MPDTYNIQVRVGTKKVILKGATSYEIIEGSEPPLIQTRAPIGGKTVFNFMPPSIDTSVVIHSIPDTDGNVGVGTPEKTE